jgi:hypothetical protein
MQQVVFVQTVVRCAGDADNNPTRSTNNDNYNKIPVGRLDLSGATLNCVQEEIGRSIRYGPYIYIYIYIYTLYIKIIQQQVGNHDHLTAQWIRQYHGLIQSDSPQIGHLSRIRENTSDYIFKKERTYRNYSTSIPTVNRYEEYMLYNFISTMQQTHKRRLEYNLNARMFHGRWYGRI